MMWLTFGLPWKTLPLKVGAGVPPCSGVVGTTGGINIKTPDFSPTQPPHPGAPLCTPPNRTHHCHCNHHHRNHHHHHRHHCHHHHQPPPPGGSPMHPPLLPSPPVAGTKLMKGCSTKVFHAKSEIKMSTVSLDWNHSSVGFSFLSVLPWTIP